MRSVSLQSEEIGDTVAHALGAVQFVDIHTHLFPSSFGGLALSGIDALLTYHYLEAELFRATPIEPAEYFSLERNEQAEVIWKALFVERPPISEATRGVVAVLHAFGLSPSEPTLDAYRQWFRSQKLEAHVDNVFRLAGVREVVMTNDPLDDAETAFWHALPAGRFRTALRLDRILNDWRGHYGQLRERGYDVDANGGSRSCSEARRFLVDQAKRIDPRYMAVSLPDDFLFPGEGLRSQLLKEAVLPACREIDRPLALMIGVRRQVNPALRLAGDGSGRADLTSLANLCEQNPENRFLVTVLSRENQHELCVYARKFPNLMPFGCWWFLNNPSLVEEITRERLEMLGTTFIPQHSDARILEQIIYKWRNTRRTIAPLLVQSYQTLVADGGAVTAELIHGDIERLFRRNFEAWVQPRAHGELS